MNKNTVIYLHTKHQILNKNNKLDLIEMDKREKNTFYNKIIGSELMNEEKKIHKSISEINIKNDLY
jgi:hypothetical protein